MSRIFISHSSRNSIQALAIKQWLSANGWDDVFLDIDPQQGLSAGEQWKNALSAAADRCQAVLCLISSHWMASHECKVEYRHAEYLGKPVFAVFIEPCDDGGLTSSWQRCILCGQGELEEVVVELNGERQPVCFSAEGLARLKSGLKKAGLDADFFPYHLHRSPYCGFRPLETEDAAVFFGRDAAIVRALDVLRNLKERDVEKMLVILGASGAGKSSFLRAGLLPRLIRDDRSFLVLPVIRPERAVLTGPRGLIVSIEQAFNSLKKGRNRADIRRALEHPAGLRDLLRDLQGCTASRFIPDPNPQLTTIIPIDQGEELFGTDGQVEADRFVSLLSEVLAQTADNASSGCGTPPRSFVIITIRSDSFERLQKEPKLESVKSRLFSLPPIAREEYKEIIEKPAARRTAEGQRLKVDPKLTEQLLQDTQGADALPLLAFTLERLLLEYGSDGELSLGDYEALGGVSGSIEAAIEAAFAEPDLEPAIPSDKAERERLLHKAFLPWLAYVDPDTEERKRRVADWQDIPIEAQPLMERLIAQRLLVRDKRKMPGCLTESVVVEVAHEALLRCWSLLSTWLDQDAETIKTAYAVKRAANDWLKNHRREAWLVHADERLRAAEALLVQPEFDRLMEEDGRTYLRACRQRDDALEAEEAAREKETWELEERRIAAEQIAERERLKLAETEARQATEREETARRMMKRTVVFALVAGVLAVSMSVFAMFASRQKNAAEHALGASSAKESSRLYANGLKSQSLAYLARAVRTDPTDAAWRASLASILLRNGWTPHLADFKGREATTAAGFSPNGKQIVTLAGDEALLWDVESRRRVGSFLRHRNAVNSAEFSPDGTRVVTASVDRTVRVWNSQTGAQEMEPIRHDTVVSFASFSTDGARIVTRTENGVHVFDARTGEETTPALSVIKPAEGHFLFRAVNRTLRFWSTDNGDRLGPEIAGVGRVLSRMFSADGKRVAIRSDDGIRVIETETGKNLMPSVIKPLPVLEWFSLDGAALLVSNAKSEGRLLNVKTGKSSGPLLPCSGDACKHMKAVLSSDGLRLFVNWPAGEGKTTAYIIDVTNGKAIGAPLENVDLKAPEYCSEGNRLMTVGGQVAYLQDATTGDSVGEPMEHSANISMARFSPDCRYVVTVAGSEARLWDALTGNPVGEPLAHASGLLQAAFSPDGNLLMTVSALGAHLWSLHTASEAGEPMRHGAHPGAAVMFSPSGNRVVTASETDARMRLWDARTGSQVGADMKTGRGLYSYRAQFSQDDTRMLLGSEDFQSSVRVWDIVRNVALGRPIPASMESSLLSPNGQLVVTRSERIARIWRADTGKRVGKPLRHNGTITRTAFSSDGRFVVTTSDDSLAKIWSTETGEITGKPMFHGGYPVGSAVFSKDGTHLATIANKRIAAEYGMYEPEPRIVQVWLAASGQPVSKPIQHGDRVTAVAISPDGKLLLTASSQAARLWDVDKTEPIGDPLDYSETIRAAKFSSDGTRILTAAGNEVILWDARNGTRLGEPIVTPEAVLDASFLPGEQSIVTFSGGAPNDELYIPGEVTAARLWDAPCGTKDDATLLASVAEAISGYSVTELGALNVLSDTPTRLAALRQTVAVPVAGEPAVHKLIRWLVADPWERTVGPSASLTVTEHVQKVMSATARERPTEDSELNVLSEQEKDEQAKQRENELGQLYRCYPGYPGLKDIERK